MQQKSGTLYLVATPIGNLRDMTFRGVDILKSVDVIACEDTRRTGLLLSHFGIHGKLESFYEHSERRKIEPMIRNLLSGKNIALVSDAGTPLVSDPGFPLVRSVIAHGIHVEGIPGPSAVLNALILSGFACVPFVFYGYLPQKDKKKRDFLSASSQEEKTLIFYESPYRLIKSLSAMADIFGSRRISVAREMTKKFEEIIRGTAAEVKSHFENGKIRGEFVIAVEGRLISDGE